MILFVILLVITLAPAAVRGKKGALLMTAPAGLQAGPAPSAADRPPRDRFPAPLGPASLPATCPWSCLLVVFLPLIWMVFARSRPRRDDHPDPTGPSGRPGPGELWGGGDQGPVWPGPPANSVIVTAVGAQHQGRAGDHDGLRAGVRALPVQEPDLRGHPRDADGAAAGLRSCRTSS